MELLRQLWIYRVAREEVLSGRLGSESPGGFFSPALSSSELLKPNGARSRSAIRPWSEGLSQSSERCDALWIAFPLIPLIAYCLVEPNFTISYVALSFTVSTRCVKAAVHWVRVSAFSAESSPKSAWDAMGLRADSARRLSVRDEPLTR